MIGFYEGKFKSQKIPPKRCRRAIDDDDQPHDRDGAIESSNRFFYTCFMGGRLSPRGGGINVLSRKFVGQR